MTEPQNDDEVLELAARPGHKPRAGTWGRTGSPGKRYVRTPEGSDKYGLPIGSLITRDAIARAKARGRNYSVPEDDNSFGSQAPTGRTKRPAPDIVRAIRSAPSPKIVTPDGPKKIAVGQSGFSFPAGSRAFRSQKHNNFALVRTPDYQLVGITKKGVAFELAGELEKELNAEIDDDSSEIWLPDEPNPNLLDDVDGDGQTGQAGDSPDAGPARVEDSPGFMSEEMIQGVLDGMKGSGIDQNAVDMAELHIRRNNDKIRKNFETKAAAKDAAPAPKLDELGDPIVDEPVGETREKAPVPVPSGQPKGIGGKNDPVLRDKAKRDEMYANPIDGKGRPADKPADPGQKKRVLAEVDDFTKNGPKSDSGNKKPTPEEDLTKLEELTRSRPSGVAEGEINRKKVSLRRNRVDDSIEYSDNKRTFKNRDEVLKATKEDSEPRDTSELEPSDMTDDEIKDLLADIDDGLRAGLISRKDARERRSALAAEQEKRGASTADAPDVAEADAGVGEPASKEWADTAEPGSAAETGDGLVAVRTDDGKWDTPLGPLASDIFDESDVEDDEPVIVRAKKSDRPIGATKRMESREDLDAVSPTDGLAFVVAGETLTSVRNSDGTFDIDLPGGLKMQGVDIDAIAGMIEQGGEIWHVPNQGLTGKPSKTSWKPGDVVRRLDDVIAQKIGTKLRYKFLRPVRGENGSDYTVLPNGQLRHDRDEVTVPAHGMKAAINSGRISITSIPSGDSDPDVDPTPRVVANLADYKDGDQISDYRHLRSMKPGAQVTLMVPASKNGGKPTTVLLTRTDDSSNLGGFMFLVGKAGRGYNSFGENNASIFQAIHDGNLHFGDVTNGLDMPEGETMQGQWDTTKNIELWKGGSQVSEFDIRTFIDAQVHARAMQGSYFNTSLLPKNSPFRSKVLRDTFADKAIEQYSTKGNPARHKPAMIRLAAEKVGLNFTDPGSALIPDDLELADFNKKVTVGRWLRKTNAPAEVNMGPEQIDVSVADIKTAMAVLDNMLTPSINDDPDKILKRVFAMRGSPLQDMNVAVSIAAYFGMRRYKNGSSSPMTTIARQHDKTTNKELLRQMLREQLEGRTPGYYGVPATEKWTNANGDHFENRPSLQRPAINSDNDPDPNAALRGDNPVAPTAEDLVDTPDRIPTVGGDLSAVAVASTREGDRIVVTRGDGTQFSTTRRGGDLVSDDNTTRIFADADVVQAYVDDDSYAFQRGTDSAPEGASDPQPGQVLSTADDFAALPDEARVIARNPDGGNPLGTKRGDSVFWDGGNTADDFETLAEFSRQGWVYEVSDLEPDPTPEPDPVPSVQAPSIYSLRADNPDTLYIEDANGNITTPKTKRVRPAEWDRPLVYDQGIAWKDRQAVFELDASESQVWLDLANKHSQGYTTYTQADIQGRRLFVTDDGDGVALLDGDTVRGIELELNLVPNTDTAIKNLRNLMPALVANGARTALLPDRSFLNGNLSPVGMRATSFSLNPNGSANIAWTLDPDYINNPAVRPDPMMPSLQEPLAIQGARTAFDLYEKRDFHMAVDKGRAGDGKYKGTKLWGKYGASGLLMRHTDKGSGEERFLLVQRAGKNKKAALYGKWQLPGGGNDQKETDAQAAARETVEELKPPAEFLSGLTAVGENVFNDKSGWHYANLTADTPVQFTPKNDPHEILDAKWLTRAEIAQMESNGELHPSMSDSIRKTLATFGGTEANALPTQKPKPATSIFTTQHGSINDKGASKIPGTMAGSNGGMQYDIPMPDGTTARYFVKPSKAEGQSRQEALAADLYRLAGAKAPEVDYSATDKSLYSKMMNLSQRGPSNFQDLVREDFAADAWLANWDVRVGDNIMFDMNGDPVRLDNGGSMEYSATGRKKTFGSTVAEIDSLRQAGNIGANTFGARRPGAYDIWERTSAQRVVNVPDQTIRDLVGKHGLPPQLAMTLIARRDDIANRYGIMPTKAPSKITPAKADAAIDEVLELNPPEAPKVTSVAPAPTAPKTGAPSLFDKGNDQEKLTSHPVGMVPTVGDPYKLTVAADGTDLGYVAETTPKFTGHGVAIHATSKLYQELGLGTVNAEYDSANNKVLTSLVAEGPDAGDAGKKKFREGFVADAWLGNRAIGQNGKYVYDPQGNPVRVDNRGSLDMRLNGQKKPDFGNTVSELNSLRDPNVNAGAAALYGQRQNGKFDDFEFEGAQKIVDLPDARVREIVKDAGGDIALADTLIARKMDIATHYGLVPTGQKIPALATRSIDAAESLRDARTAIGGARARYVNAKLAPGEDYLTALKKAGNLDNAFEAAWKKANPGKPDYISGGKITGQLDITTAKEDEIIDLVASFDFDSKLMADKAKELNSNVRDPRVLHEVMAEQRGFHDTNAPIDPDELDRMVAKDGHRHVYRTVNPHGSHSGITAADEYKKDGHWRRGDGFKAHGEGVYVAQILGASLGYGHGRAGVVEMTFDRKGAKVAPSSDFQSYGGKMRAIQNRIQARTDLDANQKAMLSRVFTDEGTAAMALGYDALYGNANYGYGGNVNDTNDFNLLNKGRVYFSNRPALGQAALQPYASGRTATADDYRKAQKALQPTLRQANSVQNPTTTVGAPASASGNAAGIVPGQTIRSTDLANLGIGSEITTTLSNGTVLHLRLDARGWINTATNRAQGWIGKLTSRSRTRFDVVIAN